VNDGEGDLLANSPRHFKQVEEILLSVIELLNSDSEVRQIRICTS
jgi:hypothetical protein